MPRDIAQLLYGTSDVEQIIAQKQTGKQIRAFGSGSKGKVMIDEKECKRLCDKIGLEYLSGYEHRVREYVITDETSDRYGDIVRAKGVLTDNYRKNPVIQFAHDYSQLPVGNTIKIWYDKNAQAVVAWGLFFDNRVDGSGRSDLIYRFTEANAMRACSIGFNAIEINYPKTDEERKALGLGEYGIEFIKTDLLEFSPVAVPANPNALQNEYKQCLATTLRNGAFSVKDVDTLREYPLFETSIMDVFIRTLDSKSIVSILDSVILTEDNGDTYASDTGDGENADTTDGNDTPGQGGDDGGDQGTDEGTAEKYVIKNDYHFHLDKMLDPVAGILDELKQMRGEIEEIASLFSELELTARKALARQTSKDSSGQVSLYDLTFGRKQDDK